MVADYAKDMEPEESVSGESVSRVEPSPALKTRAQRFGEAQAWALTEYADTLAKLAKHDAS